ncbi:hypothetical protein FRC12_014966 [Ceratobasidium sp. 428]|nr:hypothetical protein FRC12_014966 [Ceratobasidium sp. 428]
MTDIPEIPPQTSYSDSKWGPLIREYLECPEAGFDFMSLPEESAIITAINDLYHRTDAVTYRTLQTIMAVIYRPRLMTLFLHQRAIASCMYLMRAYTARDDSSFNGLLDHAFGFLVLHVLALILQAGMLHSFHSDWLKNLPLLLGPSRKYEWNIKAPALHIEFICSLVNYISSDMPGRVNAQSLSAPYRFEWCEGTWGLDRACLPSVGGFTFRDAEFILQQLFGSRKTFLECCLLPSAPGWTMLMIVLHLHVKEQSLGDRRIRTLWKHQHDIAYRFMLVSGVGADGLLERVGASFRSNKFSSELEGSSSVVDI